MTRLAALLCLLAFPAFGYTVVDGDTLKIDGERHRIIGFNTPEMNGKCAYEKRLARQAKAYVESLDLAITYTGRSDRYGRPLIHVFVDGRNLADIMIEKGFAERYVCDPRCPKRRSWCD